MEIAKLVVSVLGLVGTAVAVVIALRSFWRTEKWKRAEFLAREMKEFFDNPRVQNALLLIDWGSRRIPLSDVGPVVQGGVQVTRAIQVHALLPHTIANDRSGSDDAEQSETREASEHCDGVVRYPPPEPAIRDCYDAFLDGLERFSSYAQAGLIDVAELRPYLDYWIEDIHAPAKSEDDAAWSAALVTYIAFYRFHGVQWLFRAFACSIDPSEPVFAGFLSQMRDQHLAARLAQAVDVPYDPAIHAGPA